MIAVLSDIHANLPALEAALADMPPVTGAWVLGDIVGELPYPCGVLDRLSELSESVPVAFVAGNRELSLLEAKEGLHPDWWEGTQLRPLAWTADRLRPHHWEAMRGWLPCVTLDSVSGGAALFHGAPNQVRGLLRTREAAKEAARHLPQRWLAGGHTHQQAVFCLDVRTYVNAGSVGVPLDGTGGVAAYALLDECGDPRSPACISFRHVPYNVEAVIQELERSGLTELAPGIMRALVLELRTGRHQMMHLVSFCKAYAERELGHPVEHIPPALWREAEQRWNGAE